MSGSKDVLPSSASAPLSGGPCQQPAPDHVLQSRASPTTKDNTQQLNSHEPSTSMQTPSPLTRLRQTCVCKCGSNSFTNHFHIFNCKACGAFLAQTPDANTFAFVSSTKD